MVTLSAVFGGVGSGVGAYLSITMGNVPTGPVIVLVLFGIFLVSLLMSPKRSVVVTALRRVRVRQALKRDILAESDAS